MFNRFRNLIFLFVANTFIGYKINHKQSGFIGGHFENMHINPLPGVRFIDFFSGTRMTR